MSLKCQQATSLHLLEFSPIKTSINQRMKYSGGKSVKAKCLHINIYKLFNFASKANSLTRSNYNASDIYSYVTFQRVISIYAGPNMTYIA